MLDLKLDITPSSDDLSVENRLERQLDLNHVDYKDDQSPLSVHCSCHACSNHTRMYVHHLLISKEMTG